MSPVNKSWFLPESPDLRGMLCEQTAVTHDGLVAFAAWTAGDAAAGDAVRAAEHRADHHKRELWRSLRVAFISPIDAEDLFSLSSGLDEVLNGAKDVVRQAEVLSLAPDECLAEMAEHLVEGVVQLAVAFRHLGAGAKGSDAATEAADAAIKAQRDMERSYRQGMASLGDVEDLREVMGRRDLYQRVAAVSEQLRHVAERVWYAVVKEG